MKILKSYTLTILSIAVFAVLVSSCASTSISIKVLVPAQIYIPQHIKKVVIANRSLPEKDVKSKINNILEGLVTGESILADREGSKRCIGGLQNKLNTSPRFDAVSMYTLDLRGTGTRKFPVTLSWTEVDKICKQYDADGLILLETFDSNIGLKKGERDVKRKVEGKEVVVKEFLADLNVNVNAGWRIYDAVNKKIADESTFMDSKSWGSKGGSPDKAMSGLPSKRGAINDAGYFAGQQYGIRISPNWMRKGRSYFTKGHNDFKSAKRHAKTDDWDGAAKIWESLISDPDPRIAGRAAYNMALACEMAGELDTALEWADESYQKYNIKKAREYSRILKRRLADQERLNRQMGE